MGARVFDVAKSINWLGIGVDRHRSEQLSGKVRSTEKLHEDLVSPYELASDTGTGYLLGSGQLGHTYTSDTAPTLSRAAFLTMLAESEAAV